MSAAIADDLPLLICRFLPDTTLTYVNRAYARTFGVSARALRGRRWLDQLPPAQRPAVLAELACLTAAQPERTYEHAARDAAGAVRWYRWTDRAQVNKAGKVTAITSYGADISELRETQRALQQSEQRLFAAMNLLSQGVYELAGDGRLLRVNQAGLAMSGYTAADVARGLQLADLIVPEDRARAEADLARVLAGEVLAGCEYRLRRRDGSILPVLEYSLPVVEQGTIVGIRGIFNDITELSAARTALEESRNRLQQLFDNSSDIIWETDAVPVFTFISPAVRRILRYAPEELLGRAPFTLLMDAAAEPATRAAFAAVSRGGNGPVVVEHVLRHRDGQAVHIETRAMPRY
ncbi:MAG TPA: PAS domain S-box protein, partial [bacterium]|nr:PAS domain S-box protein [bacterium]